MARSDTSATVSVSEAVLLFVLGSLVLLVTVAVLVWSPVVEAGTVYLMVSVAEAPETSVPTVQVLLEKLPTLGVAILSLKPVGKVSATDTFWASDRPPLCTVMV